MQKLECKCGSRDFCIDKQNAGRCNCIKCGQHFTWNGQEFVKTTPLQRIKQEIERILGIEKKPEPVRPEVYGETEADKQLKEMLLRERKEIRELKKKQGEQTVLLDFPPAEQRARKWPCIWRDYCILIVEKGLVKVDEKEHVGCIRGKHILKEAHRRFNSLGHESRISFGKETIEFLGNKEKALEDLRSIETWG